MVKKFYIETYGCQMNVADSEVVAAHPAQLRCPRYRPGYPGYRLCHSDRRRLRTYNR